MRQVGGLTGLAIGGITSLRHLLVRDSNEMRARGKANMLRHTLGGRNIAEIEAAGRAYAQTLPELYRASTLERIAWHRAEGHMLVLVSASLRVYAEPAAKALGFDHVIAVDLDVDPAGRLTGELAGSNIRGPEKARRLRELLGESRPSLWAYGDSAGDEDMLAMADHPTWVGRRASA